MKSVMFSEIVRARRRIGLPGACSPLAAYGVAVAIGMPLLVLALRSFAPGAPLAAIVLPLLVLLALPLCAGAPGRLEVSTRFDACHMRHTLDAALAALGYIRTHAGAGQLRYARAVPLTWRDRAQGVNVRIGPHTLEVVGPIPTLRALQAALSGAAREAPAPAAPQAGLAAVPAPPGRETVAAAMQISDNAGRVAGMAE